MLFLLMKNILFRKNRMFYINKYTLIVLLHFQVMKIDSFLKFFAYNFVIMLHNYKLLLDLLSNEHKKAKI